MDDAQRRITDLDAVHDDSHSKQIVNLVESLVLIHHLLIDTEEMLHSSVHLGYDGRLV